MLYAIRKVCGESLCMDMSIGHELKLITLCVCVCVGFMSLSVVKVPIVWLPCLIFKDILCLELTCIF